MAKSTLDVTINNCLDRPDRNLSRLMDYARLLRVGGDSRKISSGETMSKENITNYGKSIRTKLLNVAKKEDAFYQTVLTRYFQERLLYRMSQTRFRSNFYLKGGALLYAFLKKVLSVKVGLRGVNTKKFSGVNVACPRGANALGFSRWD